MKNFPRFGCSTFFACLIFYLCVMQLPDETPPSFQIPNFDKIVHILMYFGLTGLLFTEYFKLYQNFTWKQTFNFLIKNKITDDMRPISTFPYFLLGALSLLYGGLIEIIQDNFIPNRFGDWFDLLADLGGILLSLSLFFAVKHFRLKPVTGKAGR